MKPYERLRHLRKNILKSSLKVFSASINVSLSNLGNIETGRIGMTDRVTNDICREYSVNKEWLLTGQEPIFIENSNAEVDEILEIYKTLNDDNRKYLQGYIHRLLEEQNKDIP